MIIVNSTAMNIHVEVFEGLFSIYLGMYFGLELLGHGNKISSLQFCGTLREVTEKAKAAHSSTLAWKIPWTEEPGRLQSMGLLRVGYD